MPRASALPAVAVLALGCGGDEPRDAAPVPGGELPGPAPDVLVVLVDRLEAARTPPLAERDGGALAALAEEGIAFARAFAPGGSPAAVAAELRAAILGPLERAGWAVVAPDALAEPADGPPRVAVVDVATPPEAFVEARLDAVDARLEALLPGRPEDVLVVVTACAGHWSEDNVATLRAAHVPLLLRLPGRLPAGAVARQVVSTADLARTLGELVGVDAGDAPGASFARLAQRRPQVWRGDALVRAPGGEVLWVDARWALRRDGDGGVGFLFVGDGLDAPRAGLSVPGGTLAYRRASERLDALLLE